MKSSSRIVSTSCILPLALCVPAAAQRNSGGTTSGGSSAPSSRPSTPNVQPSIPSPGTNFPNTQTQRQILYISGAVVMQDGTPPPEPVAIERVCGGAAHKEGYTDSKGR